MGNLYGNQMIPNDISSLYFYDKTYSYDDLKSETLASKALNDGVFIGRYILVKGNGDSKTHSKAYRKVIKDGQMAYDEVAVLDAATTSFNTTSAAFGASYLDPATVLNTPSDLSANTIQVTNSGVYNETTGTYDVDLQINLPSMGEAVGQVYNILYGTTNRADSRNISLADIKVGGATLEADGLVGLLKQVDWDHMNDVSKAQWANTYLGLNEAPTKTIGAEYLALKGGTMTGSIKLENDANINGSGSNIAFVAANDNSENPVAAHVSIDTNLSVTNAITSNPGASMSTTTMPNYEKIERLINNDGHAYVLADSDYTNNNGTITLTNAAYKSKPAGTIFFIPVKSS